MLPACSTSSLGRPQGTHLSPCCAPLVSLSSFCGAARPSLATSSSRRTGSRRRSLAARASFIDTAWATTQNPQDLASGLFASSIIPYAGFLYHITRSKQAPGKTLFGFYFLLVFVFGTIPCGIIAKTQYGTSLSNVDYLHGSAESLLTITNLLIVLGLRQGLRDARAKKEAAKAAAVSESSNPP